MSAPFKKHLPIFVIFVLVGLSLGRVRAAELPQGVLEDPGLLSEESNTGCRYSNSEGLVYFCGWVRDSQTAAAAEGVTVAVYEELPSGPSLTDPAALYSSTGKYGGNLVHLFTSTWTNKDGHFEITGRQGRNVYVAFLCGDQVLGGLKRIEELSRIEKVNELVNCSGELRYAEPPPQLSYVDRLGNLECTANIVQTLQDALREDSQEAVDGLFDPVNVGYSSNPTVLARSEITVENYDYRFMPIETAKNSLNVGALGSSAVDIDEAFDPIGPRLADDSEWLGDRGLGSGPWREADCRKTYESFDIDLGDSEVSLSVCSPGDINRYLSYTFGFDYTDDLYTILNHLWFIPPKASLPAFARVDIRTSLRQFSESNSSVAKYMDAVFGNYVGEKALVKEPGSAEGITEDEFSKDSTLISCGELKASMDINNLSETSGPGGMLRPPGVLEDAAQNIGLDQLEMNSPVCQDGALGTVTAYDACYERPYLGLCRPEFFVPKGTGSSMMSYTTAEEADSMTQEELRSAKFSAVETAAEDAWRDQKEVILPGETNVHAARTPLSAAYISGSADFGGNSFLSMLNAPSADGTSPTSSDSDASSEESINNEEVTEGEEEGVVQVSDLGLGETPDEPPKEESSPNAVREEIIVQDVGPDSVAHCTISTIFDEEAGGFEKLARGYIGVTNPLLYLYLSNKFTGNQQHAYEATVGSGTFYTQASLNRDAYLATDNQVARTLDIFDGLRSIASGGTRIDFATLNSEDIETAVTGATGTGNIWLGRLSELLGRGANLSATKSFGDRANFSVSNMTSMSVYYPLNEENFDSYFPIPEEPYTAGSWGEHSNYPWTPVPEGQFCNTAPDARGLSRTCRVSRCGSASAEVQCDSTGCEVIPGRIIETDDCTPEERRSCAVDQEATSPKISSAREAILVQVCADTGDCEFEEEFRPVCNMERAGPYTAAAALSYKIANKVTQENRYETQAQVPLDTMTSSAEDLAKAFAPPQEQFVGSRVSADIDVAHSESPDDAGVSTQGYPVTGVGGVPDNIYTVSAPPTTDSVGADDNPITYHCNNLGISIEGTVKGGDWNCPVAPIPACSGLFGQVQGIDQIAISPAGQTAIRNTFSLEDFEGSLEAYATIEEEFGIPCEVMAGVHYREASNDPGGSFEDGGDLRNGNLIADARIVAEDLLNDMGVSKQPGGLAISTIEGWAEALLHHNGYGNSQCSAPAGTTNYSNCPPDFTGEDNSYVMAYSDSNHDNMAIIYPQDGTPSVAFCATVCPLNPPNYQTACGLCPAPIEEPRVGALVLAKYLYNLGKTAIVR